MSNHIRTLGVIPARYASTRLPAKPLVDLLGKPMIQRVYERARMARSLDQVVVATDDERIASVVRSFGGTAIMTSPDLRSGTDRMAAVAEQMPADLYVNVQGDEPLIDPAMIDQAVRLMDEDPSAQVGTLARRITSVDDLRSPSVVKVVMEHTGRARYFSRSPIPFVRDEPSPERWLERHEFYKHIGLYVFRGEFLKTYVNLPQSKLELAEGLEQLRVIENGYAIRVGVTDLDSIPIDTPQDVERVTRLLRAQAT